MVPLDSELRQWLAPDDPQRLIAMPGFVADNGRPCCNGPTRLVVTSDHEGIPMGVLEALASGIPVLWLQCGGDCRKIAAPGPARCASCQQAMCKRFAE